MNSDYMPTYLAGTAQLLLTLITSILVKHGAFSEKL